MSKGNVTSKGRKESTVKRHTTKKKRIVVYVDGNNLYKGIKSLGWRLDYTRFFKWLQDKYNIEECFIFLGYIPEHEEVLYKSLRDIGYSLVFKKVSYGGGGEPKGNVDSDLVQKVNEDFMDGKFDYFILVTADGDYARMVRYYKEKGIFHILLAPCNEVRNSKKECGFSYLLRELNIPILYLGTQRNILEIRKRKTPDGDKTP